MSYSDDGNGFFTRALDAEDRGDHTLAETSYRQAIELFQESGPAHRELAACHYNLGHIHLVMDRTSKAVRSTRAPWSTSPGWRAAASTKPVRT